jgi:hypothetical protein
MSAGTVTYMQSDGGRVLFRITDRGSHSAAFGAVVEEAAGWLDDGTIEYEPYLTCTIKWDSCSHIYFDGDPEERGYFHMCGVRDLKQHVELMKFLYETAFKAMGREPMSGEEWA